MPFSVVIPLYNKASSIANTLESILGQSYADFEVLVVDDGSTDKSANIVRSFEDNRLTLIQKENGGVCSARNIGIEMSRYEYVAFLDADDLWDKDYLIEQKKMIEDFPEVAMWGINFAETENSKLIRELPTGLPKGYRGIVEDYFGLAEKKGRVSDLFCSSSVVIRKSAFEKAGMFDERLKYSEDIDMWFRIIANFPVAFYDRYMAFYQYDADNRAMNRNRKLKYWLPYYPDKYAEYKGNEPFYSYIQRWCGVNIKNVYFNDKTQRNDAWIAAKKLDYSVLPAKYKHFFDLPYPIAKVLYLLGEAKNKLV
mgnify:CR=1 FL=1